MVSIGTTVTNIAQSASKMSNLKKVATGIGLGTLANAALNIIPDFLGVPSAFDLKYDTEGNKVEGTNSKSGWKEIGKSALRCAGYCIIPVAIGGALAGIGGGIIATIGAGMLLGTVYNKILPTEHELVAKACEEKGIDYKPKAPDLLSFLA